VYVAEDNPATGQPAQSPTTLPAPAGGPDGAEVASHYAGQLEYLSNLAHDLGVPDPVEEYFSPVVGRWSDLEAEAKRWRQVGDGALVVTDALNKPLGGLDAAWDGEAATSFIAYMQKVGLAGHDLSDAMNALAEVLDTTAQGIREIVQQLGDVLANTAESASQAMVLPVQGDERTRQFLDAMRRPTKELFESVRQVLEAFVQMCQGIDGSEGFKQIQMAHTFPEGWSWGTQAPGATAGVDPRTSKASADLAGVGAGGFGGVGGGGVGASGFSGGGLSGLDGDSMGSGGSSVATEQAPDPKPAAATAAGAATGSGTTPRMGGGMMPMSPMMGMGNQGGGGEHKARTRVVADPQELFGKPDKASAPVIGDDDY
jgi:uncharacterized protein YukE